MNKESAKQVFQKTHEKARKKRAKKQAQVLVGLLGHMQHIFSITAPPGTTFPMDLVIGPDKPPERER